jgi:hypothetical protein
MPPSRPQDVVIRRIRVPKKESAFVYFILEAQEGIVSYSTLDPEPGQDQKYRESFRDLRLSIPVAFVDDTMRVLKELGDRVVLLDEEK